MECQRVNVVVSTYPSERKRGHIYAHENARHTLFTTAQRATRDYGYETARADLSAPI